MRGSAFVTKRPRKLKPSRAHCPAIREILPTGGFGARYAEEHAPDWV
ncbi:hypothetical protein AB0L50_32455 [Streptomyces flaveolus]